MLMIRLPVHRAALPGSFSVGFRSLLCPIAAIFINRFGCRVAMPCGGFISALGLLGSSFAPNIYVLSFTYGFLVACGSCLVYMAGFLMVPLYFDKHRSAATGMVSAGPGAGVLIMGPIAHMLIDYLGWRKAMLVLAGMNLVTSILGCTITRKVQKVHSQNKDTTSDLDGKKKNIWSAVLQNLSALKNPMLILVVAMNTTFYFGHFMPLVHLIKYAEDIGISSHASSWMYPVTGMISTVCRILTGKVGDTGRVSFYTMFQCGLLLMAITQFLMPLASNIGYLYGYAVMQGICEAMYFTSAYCLAMSVDPRQGLAWLMFFASIPMFLGPPIAGLIADYSRSYRLVFYISGCFLVLASLLPFLRHCIKRPVVLDREQVHLEEFKTLSVVERETVL
ncbi:monocarboxylate transporter 10-like isoform X3 [Exaiptasia diaphana]|uniref:Major facilitator superfamily (MFS) profile domain-containing protein n=1 Tax=Exaiptasia diaphana TaxID=2652724 RepID=A0A913Y3W6_EXADI|nr:monocarboxylate transporter 10-like isoform X3 [Exaiptasia diaphana]